MVILENHTEFNHAYKNAWWKTDLKYHSLCSVMSDSLRPHELQPTRLLWPRDFPGKNTGMGCYFILQGRFLTQGSNLCLCVSCIGRQVLYNQHHSGLIGKVCSPKCDACAASGKQDHFRQYSFLSYILIHTHLTSNLRFHRYYLK